jgi:hypothetical protein
MRNSECGKKKSELGRWKAEWGMRKKSIVQRAWHRAYEVGRGRWKKLKVGGWEAGKVRIEVHRAERTVHSELSWVKISESGRWIF